MSTGKSLSKATAGTSTETGHLQLLLQHLLNWGPWKDPPKSVSSKQAQPTQQYDVQLANRGSNPWTEWAREVWNSQPFPVPMHGMRQLAALTPGDRNGTHSHQDGLDHVCGLLQLQRI